MQEEEVKAISKKMGFKEECIWPPVLMRLLSSLIIWLARP